MNIGIDPTRVTDQQEFKLGTKMASEGPEGTKEFVYVQAGTGGFTGEGYVGVIDSATGEAVMLSTTNSAPGQLQGAQVGVAQAALQEGEFGWLQVYGKTGIRVAASCAKGTLLNTTGTAGQIDDDATSGAEVVEGAVLNTAAGSGGAESAPGFVNYPRVGATIPS